MPVGGVVFVERAGGKIQHAVVQGRVLQNQLVGRCLVERGHLGRFGHELAVVQVTLVHAPQVYQAEQPDAAHRERLAQLACSIEPEEQYPDGNDDEAAQRVGLHQRGTHLRQVGQYAVQLAGGNHALVGGALQHLCLLGGHVVRGRRGCPARPATGPRLPSAAGKGRSASGSSATTPILSTLSPARTWPAAGW